MSDTYENEPSLETEEKEGKTEKEEVTYSWVNPKLQKKEADEDAAVRNPWSSGTQGSWRTETKAQEPEMKSAPAEPEKKKKKKRSERKTNKPAGSGRKWVTTVAMAVVFGLVAGLVFTAVTMGGRALTGSDEVGSRIEIAPATQEKAETGAVKTEEASSERQPAAGGTVADVAAQCIPSLVTISTISVEEMRSFFGQTQQYEVSGAGTGVIVGQNDTELLIATNNHVIEGAKSLSVGFIDETAVSGAIKGYDASTDLAVVAVKLEDISGETMEKIRFCEMGNSDELVLGEQVVAIGNALGYGQSVTSGYISAFNRELHLQDNSGRSFSSTGLIQTDASINSGNSGGALLNMRGQLVGINEAKSSGSSSSASVDNIGFAIPISKAEPILKNLMTLTTRDKVDEEHAAYIGITCADVSAEMSQMYNMPTGVCFTGIMEGGPAEQAGLKKGDILTSFDGREVGTYDELVGILQYYSAGETVDLIIQRSDEGEYTERTITLTLGSASDMPEKYSSGENEEASRGGRGILP